MKSNTAFGSKISFFRLKLPEAIILISKISFTRQSSMLNCMKIKTSTSLTALSSDFSSSYSRNISVVLRGVRNSCEMVDVNDSSD